jgi:hypothetical protein
MQASEPRSARVSGRDLGAHAGSFPPRSRCREQPCLCVTPAGLRRHLGSDWNGHTGSDHSPTAVVVTARQPSTTTGDRSPRAVVAVATVVAIPAVVPAVAVLAAVAAVTTRDRSCLSRQQRRQSRAVPRPPRLAAAVGETFQRLCSPPGRVARWASQQTAGGLSMGIPGPKSLFSSSSRAFPCPKSTPRVEQNQVAEDLAFPSFPPSLPPFLPPSP